MSWTYWHSSQVHWWIATAHTHTHTHRYWWGSWSRTGFCKTAKLMPVEPVRSCLQIVWGDFCHGEKEKEPATFYTRFISYPSCQVGGEVVSWVQTGGAELEVVVIRVEWSACDELLVPGLRQWESLQRFITAIYCISNLQLHSHPGILPGAAWTLICLSLIKLSSIWKLFRGWKAINSSLTAWHGSHWTLDGTRSTTSQLYASANQWRFSLYPCLSIMFHRYADSYFYPQGNCFDTHKLSRTLNVGTH